MKKFLSLPIVMLLALIASESSAFTKHFHDGEAHWYVMPKIGVAPTIFVKKTTPQLFVVPAAGLDANGAGLAANYANVLQEGPRLPKFNDMFHQGVLHVGLEFGRSICDRSECFLEFTYNRASGKCYGYCNPFVTLAAAEGCPGGDCSNDCSSSSCSSSCDDGCPSGTSLSIISSLQDNYSNYQTYGGFIGARHFTNRFWCDNFSFWYGYKVGMLHRKAVDSCSTVVYNTSGISACQTPTAIASVSNTLNRAVFCKSNSVAGGLQIGFDYCWSDNLSFQLGGEIVASAGLRGNRNFANDVTAVKCGTTALPPTALLPSNVIVSNSGTVLNFPVWLGLTWEFGGCFSSCR